MLGEAGEREVDPLGLVARGSAWYLVALANGEPRTYRVSRIQSVEALPDSVCERPGDFNLAEWWERSAAEFRGKLPVCRAVFLAEPGVLRWARYRGWRLEEETPEGDRVRLRIRFDGEEEAVQFGLSFGGDVEVIEPEELRTKVRAGALAIVARYANRLAT